MKDDNSGPLCCHDISNKDSFLFGHNEEDNEDEDDGYISSAFNITQYLWYPTFAVNPIMLFFLLQVNPGLPILPLGLILYRG